MAYVFSPIGLFAKVKGKTSGTIFLMSTQEKRFQKKCNLYFSKEHKMRDSLGTLSVH